MRIAIDIRALTDTQTTGVGFYTWRLVEALAKQAPHHEFWLFASGSQNVLRRLPAFKRANIHVHTATIPNRLLSALMLLPGGPTLESFLPVTVDLWLFPKNNFLKTHLPYWLTVHDLAFEIFPEFITSKARLFERLVRSRQLAAHATGLFAVSASTAQDLEQYWGVHRRRIHITPLGVEHENYTAKQQPSDKNYRATYDLNRPYLLALATQEPRKNLESIIDAYSLFRTRHPHSLPLVLAGAEGWKRQPLDTAIARSQFREDIFVLGYIPEKHKAALYRGASCFLFPSFYEGFGLPVLEAMACGLPVITSVTSSLPEIVGTAGLLVDPFNVNDIVSGLEQLFDPTHGKALRAELSRAAIEQARSFTWELTAQTTLRAIEGATSNQ